MDQINPLAAIASMIMLLVVLSIFLGILNKIYSIILAILAFPTYLGLYALESFMPYKNKHGHNVVGLNIAKKNPAKLIMNICASFITLGVLSVVEKIWYILGSLSEQDRLELLELALTGQLFAAFELVIFMVCLIVIYVISYFWAEKDENDSWTKIENLSIPSLWKSVVKDI